MPEKNTRDHDIVVFGATGFTGRVAMGQRPIRWSDVASYIEAVRGLFRGEVVTWDGDPLDREMRRRRSIPFEAMPTGSRSPAASR